jgi:hypothetical protein
VKRRRFEMGEICYYNSSSDEAGYRELLNWAMRSSLDSAIDMGQANSIHEMSIQITNTTSNRYH